jgi:Uma2 family endonuclease
VMIVRGAVSDYRARTPTPEDVLLIVEVSDSTLRYDRGTKSSIYASGRVPEYWILDVFAKTLEVRTEPRGRQYTSAITLRSGSVRAPATKKKISLDRIFD